MPDSCDYRAKLYGRYVETHLAAASRPLSREALAYEAKVYAKTFAALLPRNKTARIFEVGCGTGSFLHYLHQAGYTDACGMDMSAQAVEAAVRLGVAGASHGDARAHLNHSPNAYDCIVAIDVLEHLRKEELFPFLETARAALKPGGILLWRSPNADGPFFGRIRYGDLTHELAFTRHSAFQLMAAAGFSEVEVRGETPVATGARSLLRRLLWTGASALARLYLWAESCESGALLTPNLIVRARKA